MAHPLRPRSSLRYVLILVIAGCSASPSVLLTSSPSPSAIATAPTPTSALATSSPEPAHWVVSELPAPEGVAPCVPDDGGLQNLRVVAFGPGLLALGSCAHSASPSWVWVSGDGHTWQASAPAVLVHADVYDLKVIDGLIVAAGQDVTDGFAAAAWTSRDGLSWTRSKGDLGCAVMSSVTRFGSRFVAFGAHVPNDVPDFESTPTGVCQWVSSDGVGWEAVVLPKAVFPVDALITAVSIGPRGLVAVGVAVDLGHGVGALWVSDDGRVWTRRPAPGHTDWQSLDATFPGGPGLVVIGSDMRGNAALATSADGVIWTSGPAPGPGTLSGGPSLSLDVGPAGLIFGGFPVNGAESPVMAWTSADGSSWLPAPMLPPGLPTDQGGLYYHSVAAVAGTFVVAASAADGAGTVLTLQP